MLLQAQGATLEWKDLICWQREAKIKQSSHGNATRT